MGVCHDPKTRHFLLVGATQELGAAVAGSTANPSTRPEDETGSSIWTLELVQTKRTTLRVVIGGSCAVTASGGTVYMGWKSSKDDAVLPGSSRRDLSCLTIFSSFKWQPGWSKCSGCGRWCRRNVAVDRYLQIQPATPGVLGNTAWAAATVDEVRRQPPRFGRVLDDHCEI
jgi:hypothetical protein